MKSIPLTKGKVARVDDQDYQELNQYRWYFHNGYAARSIRKSGRNGRIYMHREIMQTPKGMEVDHINGDRLYNLRSNLRNCQPSQNRQNLSLRKDTSTGYKGVCYRKDIKQYQAQITVNSKAVYLGYYPTAKEAAKVYNEAAIKHYGEFARLNEV